MATYSFNRGAARAARNGGDVSKTGKTMGLWRMNGRGGKYLIRRRDGTIPEWPGFVLGAKDPCAPAALRAYAEAASARGMNSTFVGNICQLAEQFESYRTEHGTGDPDAEPHRKDDPETARLIDTEGGGA